MDDFLQKFEQRLKDYIPGNSVDCVIFGYQNQRLKVLLLKWKQTDVWALPGGFIFKDEHLEDAAQRVLIERTGLKSVYLKQFYTFGNTQRSTNAELATTALSEQLMANGILTKELLEWLQNRFITTGYFALVDIDHIKPQPDAFSDSCEWQSIDELPSLILDHNKIIAKALEFLKVQLNYLPIGQSLLPKKFTMQDLRRLYEVILRKPLDRGNFQRKILKLDFLVRHEKQMTGAANKAPYLYSFDKRKYEVLLKEGIGFSS